MITPRRANDRGRSEASWLESRHSFSFADYHDSNHMGFRALRVINDDRVAPSSGFGTHGHRDMEIVSYVVAGGLSHKDDMGNGSTIRPGDVQRMSAGTGVRHSEWNHSPNESVHLLQIWILPEARGIQPSYEERKFPAAEFRDHLRLVAARDGRDGAVAIHQDVTIHATRLSPEQRVTHAIAPGRYAWVQVATGSLTLNGTLLGEGDGAAVSDETELELVGVEDAEALLFDLA